MIVNLNFFFREVIVLVIILNFLIEIFLKVNLLNIKILNLVFWFDIGISLFKESGFGVLFSSGVKFLKILGVRIWILIVCGR